MKIRLAGIVCSDKPVSLFYIGVIHFYYRYLHYDFLKVILQNQDTKVLRYPWLNDALCPYKGNNAYAS